MSTTVDTATDIRTFSIDIADEQIDDLRRRIAATRWPSKELVDDRSQGVQLATIQELARWSPAHAVNVVLERELRRVDSDHDQPVVSVRLRPRADVRLLAQPVDARPRPEVHEDDVAPQLGEAEWLRVEPLGRTGERGHMHTFEQRHR